LAISVEVNDERAVLVGHPERTVSHGDHAFTVQAVIGKRQWRAVEVHQSLSGGHLGVDESDQGRAVTSFQCDDLFH
jgi:hypothetical protein